jgi:hypothetical protein
VNALLATRMGPLQGTDRLKGPQHEKPFGLDMDFGEALRPFVGTKPTEAAETIAVEKEERGPPKRPPPLEDEKPLG